MYMLDTNICIYVMKNHSDKLRHKFKAIKTLCISSITYGELCFGIENGVADLRQVRYQQLDLFTRKLLIAPFDEFGARYYGQVRAVLKQQGELIGNNDLLVAAHALSMEAVLVTNNEREFNRVPNLTVENWLMD